MKNSEELKQKYNEIVKAGIKESIRSGLIKTVAITASGGKDSLATMVWAERNIKKVEITALFVNTCLEWNHLDRYLKTVCKQLGMKCVINSHKGEDPRDKVIEKGKRIGLPFFTRYCEQGLKRKLYPRGDFADLILNGTRWAESINRSSRTFWAIKDKTLFYNPILNWGLQETFESIKKRGIKLFWTYKYLRRLSCVLCPNTFSRSRIPIDMVLAQQNPGLYDYDFFKRWLNAICEFDTETLTNIDYKRKTQFAQRRIKVFYSVKYNYKLKERDIPSAGWYKP